MTPDEAQELRPMPNRKFLVGDVVMTHSGKVRYVTEIDDDDIVLSAYEDGLNPEGCEEAELTLICAVENREDRKGEFV